MPAGRSGTSLGPPIPFVPQTFNQLQIALLSPSYFAALSFQSLPHCPVCESFVLTFIQHAAGGGGLPSRSADFPTCNVKTLSISSRINTYEKTGGRGPVPSFLHCSPLATRHSSLATISPFFVFNVLRTLPSYVCSKSFASHSYKNCRGVVGFFPIWNHFNPSPYPKRAVGKVRKPPSAHLPVQWRDGRATDCAGY